MGIFKANFQFFDNCLKIHGESLIPTVFRRFLRPIRVGFLPLKKTSGGFRFQLSFRIRFPKPPWTFFYIKPLIVLAFSCLIPVPTMSNNLWCRLKTLIPGVIFASFVSRDPVGQFWDFSLIGQTLIAIMVMDASELPADFFKSFQEIRRSRQMRKSRSAVSSSENGFADDAESSKENSDCVLVNFSDDGTDSTTSSPMPSPLRDWNAVRFHLSLTHVVPNSNRRRHMCLFNLHFLVFIIVIISSFVMTTIVLDLLVSGKFCWYHQCHFLWPISLFVQRDWMTIQTQMVAPRPVELMTFDFDSETYWSVTINHECLGKSPKNVQLGNFCCYRISGRTKREKEIVNSSDSTEKRTMDIIVHQWVGRYRRHDSESFQATYQSFCSIKVMRKAFRSFIYKMIACYKCMKRGLNRFILLPVRLLLESRVTSTSSSKLGFNFLYLFQWLYLNGCLYHVPCKPFLK